MNIIIDKKINLANILQITERMDEQFIENISIKFPYTTDEEFEEIKDYFKSHPIINTIEVYQDNNLIKNFNKYNQYQGIFHRNAFSDILEILLGVKEK